MRARAGAERSAHRQPSLTFNPLGAPKKSALEWWLDDGVEDDRDRQLESLKAEHADGSASADAMAAKLADYAALARQEAKGLEGLGGFDSGMITEAETLARQLRERPTTPASSENTRRALDIRNPCFPAVVYSTDSARSAQDSCSSCSTSHTEAAQLPRIQLGGSTGWLTWIIQRVGTRAQFLRK